MKEPTKESSRVVSLRTTEMIETEAAAWLAKLDGGRFSDTNRSEFRAWLSQDEGHARALGNLASMWRDMDILLNEYPETIRHEPPRRQFRFPASRLLPVAFAMAFLCGIGLYLWPQAQPKAPESTLHATEIGVLKSETLRDGSIAHLNTNSMIEAEYLESVRIVRLIRGEAMFEVVHDPNRPFIVYAGENQIKALGTKFVVRMDSENIVVMVTDGQVQLSKRTPENESIKSGGISESPEVVLVSKGEGVEIDDNASTPYLKEIEHEDLDRRLSWLDGQLVFNNEKLEYVIAEVNRYVPNQIVIEDAELREVRVSGRFEIRNTEALLEAIEVSFQIRADRTDQQVIRLYR